VTEAARLEGIISLTGLPAAVRGLRQMDGSVDTSQAKLDQLRATAGSAAQGVAATGTKFSAFSERVGTAGVAMERTGRTMSLALTAPLVALGVKGAQAGINFDAQMSKVAAKSGATKQALQGLREQAIQLGASTSFSATQAAEGMEELAAAGMKPQQVMSAMPGLLDAAAASGENLGEVSGIVANSLAQFGLEAGQSTRIADVLAKASNETQGSITSMGEALKYAGTGAKEMGFSIEQTTGMVSMMIKAGIDGSNAGTAFRMGMQRVAQGALASEKALGKLGKVSPELKEIWKSAAPVPEKIQKMSAEFAKLDGKSRLVAASLVFGTEASAGMLQVMKQGPDAINAWTAKMEDADGSAKAMGATMRDNLKGDLEALGGAFESAFINVFDRKDSAFRELAQDAGAAVRAFTELPGPVQDAAVAVAGLTAVAGPLLMGAGIMAQGWASTVGRFGAAAAAATPPTVALAAANTALATSSNAAAAGMQRAGGAMALEGWLRRASFAQEAFGRSAMTASTGVTVLNRGLDSTALRAKGLAAGTVSANAGVTALSTSAGTMAATKLAPATAKVSGLTKATGLLGRAVGLVPFGPWGLAIGGAATAGFALNSVLDATANNMGNAADEIRTGHRETDQLVAAMREVKSKKVTIEVETKQAGGGGDKKPKPTDGRDAIKDAAAVVHAAGVEEAAHRGLAAAQERVTAATRDRIRAQQIATSVGGQIIAVEKEGLRVSNDANLSEKARHQKLLHLDGTLIRLEGAQKRYTAEVAASSARIKGAEKDAAKLANELGLKLPASAAKGADAFRPLVGAVTKTSAQIQRELHQMSGVAAGVPIGANLAKNVLKGMSAAERQAQFGTSNINQILQAAGLAKPNGAWNAGIEGAMGRGEKRVDSAVGNVKGKLGQIPANTPANITVELHGFEAAWSKLQQLRANAAAEIRGPSGGGGRGKKAVGLLGKGAPSAVDFLGNVRLGADPTMLAGDASSYADLSSGSAWGATGADGQSVANKPVQEFLTGRVAQNTGVLDTLSKRNAALPGLIARAKAARKTAKTKVANAAKAVRDAQKALNSAKGKDKIAAARKTLKTAEGNLRKAEKGYERADDKVQRLTGERESIASEILDVAGQIDADQESLADPDDQAAIDAQATRDAKNLEREALGQESVEQQEHREALNAIRRANGVAEVAAPTPTTATETETDRALREHAEQRAREAQASYELSQRELGAMTSAGDMGYAGGANAWQSAQGAQPATIVYNINALSGYDPAVKQAMAQASNGGNAQGGNADVLYSGRR
jgi:TP901 family phage tail tape measure protein